MNEYVEGIVHLAFVEIRLHHAEVLARGRLQNVATAKGGRRCTCRALSCARCSRSLRGG